MLYSLICYLVRTIAQSLEKGKSPNNGTEMAPEKVKSIFAKFSEKITPFPETSISIGPNPYQ